jgi:HAD superfamily hydrolase (TIGR01458 family)
MLRGVVLDIDGVLVLGQEVCPGAVEAVDQLRRQGLKLRFLTNSTLHSRRSSAEKLRQAGVRVDADEIITASSATAAYLRECGARSCWVMLEGRGLEEFEGIPSDESAPEYLAVGDNRSRFDFETLSRALRVIVNGAELIGMQSELVDTSFGQLELNVGSWVGMLERASGTSAVYIGKPYRYVFDLTLQSMDLQPDQVLMVGDQISIDIRGGQQAGMRTALVVAGRHHEADPGLSPDPDFIIDSVAELPLLLGGRQLEIGPRPI